MYNSRADFKNKFRLNDTCYFIESDKEYWTIKRGTIKSIDLSITASINKDYNIKVSYSVSADFIRHIDEQYLYESKQEILGKYPDHIDKYIDSESINIFQL